LAAQNVSAERGAAALLDRRHDFELPETQVSTLSLAPSRSVFAQDVGHLQGVAPHGGRPTK
jgi:hypothetical protein